MEPPPAKRKCGASGEQSEAGPAATAAAAAVETLLDLSARRVAETWAFEQLDPHQPGSTPPPPVLFLFIGFQFPRRLPMKWLLLSL
ncbi:UNVERIFIED_CONTAM: hypothetical protein K2H54_052721 [Gekko kuhli]